MACKNMVNPVFTPVYLCFLSILSLSHTERSCEYMCGQKALALPTPLQPWLLEPKDAVICGKGLSQENRPWEEVCTCPAYRFGIFDQWFLVLRNLNYSQERDKKTGVKDITLTYKLLILLVGRNIISRGFKPKSGHPNFKDQGRDHPSSV